MKMQLTKGRPVDLTGRLEKEIRVYDLLDKLGIEYEYVDHPAAMTMQDCEEVDKILNAITCKNLFLCNQQKTKFYLLMMPGEKKFVTKEVSKMIGSARLSFAPEQFMEEFLDITPGSVSVLGLMNDHENRVQLLIDEEVIKAEYFGCHPCINTSSLRMKVSDLTEKILPEVGHEAAFLQL